MDLSLILSVASPFFRDIHHVQIQHFQETVIGSQAADRFWILKEFERFAQLSFLDLAILEYFPLYFSSK